MMAKFQFKSFFLAILLLLAPFLTLAIPVEATADALDLDTKFLALQQQYTSAGAFNLSINVTEASHLTSRQDGVRISAKYQDNGGHIICVPSNDLHICQLRSTQYPSGQADMVVYDPWCNAVGTQFVENMGDIDFDIGIYCFPWKRFVEVTWAQQPWYRQPRGYHASWPIGKNSYGTIYTGCGNCGYVSYIIFFQC